MDPKMTFNPNLPRYALGSYDGGVLIKFFSTKEHRDYFINGTLYMRPQTDFPDAEMGDGRFDVMEGADIVVFPWNQKTFPVVRHEIENGNAVVKVYEYKERPKNYRDNQAFISYPLVNQKRNLFCMYTLWTDSKGCSFMPIQKDKLESFGQYGAVITDFYEFVKRVGRSLNHESSVIKAECGFVNYLDADEMKNVMDANPFYKEAEKYRDQNEFRILAETDNLDLLELKVIDGLSDIAIPIRLDDFVSSVQSNNGALTFKADSENEEDK